MAHEPLAFEDMSERQLQGALGGAMAWQLIVQDRGAGPDECKQAAQQTEQILRLIKVRKVCDDMLR